MLTQRTKHEIARMKSYVPSKYCSQPRCKLRPKPGYSLCPPHFRRDSRTGSATAKPIGPLQRRPYVSSFRAVIKFGLRTRKDGSRTPHPTITSAVNELDSFITNQCTYIPMSDIARKGLGAERKLRGLLKNIHRRWPQPNRAAVNILSAVCGAWLAVSVESTEPHPRYLRAMIYNAIFSLAVTPSRKMIVEKNGKPLVVKHRYRPLISGRLIHEAVDKHITRPIARFLMDDKAVRKAVLEGVLKHKYKAIRWRDY